MMPLINKVPVDDLERLKKHFLKKNKLTFINVPILHPKIPRLFHCRNRFLGLTQSFLNIEGAKRCQNDRTNSAVIWYFHHHCVGFKLDEQS